MMYDSETASEFYSHGFGNLAENSERTVLPPSPQGTYALRASPVVLRGSSPYLMPTVRPRILPTNQTFIPGEIQDFNPCANLEAVGWINPRSPRLMDVGGWTVNSNQLPLCDTIYPQMIYPLRRSPFFDYEFPAHEVSRDCSLMQISRERSPFSPLSLDDRGLCEEADLQRNEANFIYDRNTQPILLTSEGDERVLQKHVKQKRRNVEKAGKEVKETKKMKKEKKKGKEEKIEEMVSSNLHHKNKGKKDKKDKKETQSVKGDGGDRTTEKTKDSKKKKKLRFSSTIKECSPLEYRKDKKVTFDEDTFSISDSEVNFVLPIIDSQEDFIPTKDSNTPEMLLIESSIHDACEELKNALLTATTENHMEMNDSKRNLQNKAVVQNEDKEEILSSTTEIKHETVDQIIYERQSENNNQCNVTSLLANQESGDRGIIGDSQLTTASDNQTHITDDELKTHLFPSNSIATEIILYNLNELNESTDIYIDEEENEFGPMMKNILFDSSELFQEFAENYGNPLTSCSGEFSVIFDDDDCIEIVNENLSINENPENLFINEKPENLFINEKPENLFINEKPEIGTQTDFEKNSIEEEDERTHSFTQTAVNDNLVKTSFNVYSDEPIDEPCCSFLDKNYNTVELGKSIDNVPLCDEEEEYEGDSIYVKECDGFGIGTEEFDMLKRSPSEEFETSMEQASEPFLDARSRLFDSSDEEMDEKQSLHYAECLEISASHEGLLLESPEEFKVKLDRQPRRAVSASVVFPKKSIMEQRYASLFVLPQGRFVDLRDDVTRITLTNNKNSSPPSAHADVTSDDKTRLIAGERVIHPDGIPALTKEEIKAKDSINSSFSGIHRYLIDKCKNKPRITEKINSNPETKQNKTNDEMIATPATSSLPNISLFDQDDICRNKCIRDCKKALLVCECFRNDSNSSTKCIDKKKDDDEMEEIVRDIIENLLDFMKEISQHVTKYSSKSNLMKNGMKELNVISPGDIKISDNVRKEEVEIAVVKTPNSALKENGFSENPSNDAKYKIPPKKITENAQQQQKNINKGIEENAQQQQKNIKKINEHKSEEINSYSSTSRQNNNLSRKDIETLKNFKNHCLNNKEMSSSSESSSSITINVNDFQEMQGDYFNNEEFLESPRFINDVKYKFEFASYSSQDSFPRGISVNSEIQLLGSKIWSQSEGSQTDDFPQKFLEIKQDSENKSIVVESFRDQVTQSKEEDITPDESMNALDCSCSLECDLLKEEANETSFPNDKRTELHRVPNDYSAMINSLNKKSFWETKASEDMQPVCIQSKSQNLEARAKQTDKNYDDCAIRNVEEIYEKALQMAVNMRNKTNDLKLGLNPEDVSGDRLVCLKETSKETHEVNRVKGVDACSQTEHNIKDNSTQTRRFKRQSNRRGKGKEILVSNFGRDFDMTTLGFKPSKRAREEQQIIPRSQPSSSKICEITSSEESLRTCATQQNCWNRITDLRDRRIQIVNAIERIMVYRTINGDEGFAPIDVINLDLDMWPLEAIAHVLYLIVIIGFFIILSAILSFFYSISS